MSPNIRKLIPIYAEHNVAYVKENPSLIENAFDVTLVELSQRMTFPADQKFVEDLKTNYVEERKAEFAEAAGQKARIATCLRILLEMATYHNSSRQRLFLEVDTLKTMFLAVFNDDHWSDSQRSHIEFICGLIKEWKSFFLSYTNQDAKIVNDKYENVIEKLAFDKKQERDWNEDNILADAIIKCLGKQNLTNGFYDKNDIKPGDDLRDKVAPHCRNTFAFLQLVQREIFVVMKKKVNWCFDEYQFFLQHNDQQTKTHKEYEQVFKKRFNALLAGKKKKGIIPAQIPYVYKPWSNRIFSDQLYLPLPRDPDKFEEKIEELACEIIRLQNELIDNVPD